MPIRWVISSRKRLFYSLLQNNLLRSKGIPFTKVTFHILFWSNCWSQVQVILPFRSAFRLFLVVTISFPGHQFQLDSDRSYRSCPLLYLSFSLGEGSNYFLLSRSLIVSSSFRVSFWLLESYIGSSGYPCIWMLVRPHLESRGGNISHIQDAELVGRGFLNSLFRFRCGSL